MKTILVCHMKNKKEHPTDSCIQVVKYSISGICYTLYDHPLVDDNIVTKESKSTTHNSQLKFKCTNFVLNEPESKMTGCALNSGSIAITL